MSLSCPAHVGNHVLSGNIFPPRLSQMWGGGGGMPPTTASNVADQLSTSDFIRSVQARRTSLSIFFPDRPRLTYISDDEQYAAD